MDKETEYQEIINLLRPLLTSEDDPIANLANSAAILYNNLTDINWAGFYLQKGEELVLGPFQGKNACVRIEKGAGVCGTAWAKKEVEVVADVHDFAGHIACDPNSNSEIVVPIVIQNEVRGVLDIDSPSKGRFDIKDKQYLIEVVSLIKQETNLG